MSIIRLTVMGLAVAGPLMAISSAMADDLSRGSIKDAPLTSASWTGPYVGVALGAKWADTDWKTTSTSDLPGTIVDASSPRSYNPSGFRAGGYAGYNWQIANWVWGVEADLAWAHSRETSAGIPGCSINCAGAAGPGVDSSSVQMQWDASLRGRLGVLIDPTLLMYGTGGVAWQNFKTSGTCQHSGSDPQCTSAAGTPFDTQTNSKTLTGWTIGAGLEKMYGNWLLRAEYRFSKFDDLKGVFPFSAPGVAAGTDTSRYNLSAETHVLTAGLAYKF